MSEAAEEPKPLSVREFAAQAAAHKLVTITENRLRGEDAYEAYDLLVKRAVEDEAYSQENYAESDQIMRRGLCIGVKKRVKTETGAAAGAKNTKARAQAEIEASEEVSILRKGMRKFFEVDFNELQVERLVLTEHGRNVATIPIDSTQPYILYMTRKEDGENAQLSYSPALNKFIFGSKNFTLAAATSADLSAYVDVDATHCLAIARYLLPKLEAMEPEMLEQLKALLTEQTLIGEYVGDARFEHVVRSSRTCVKFFCAVAKNQFSGELLDIEATAKAVVGFGLEFVHYDKWTKDSRDVFEVLHEMAHRAANMRFKDILEGFVVYIFMGERQLCLKFKSLAYKVEQLFLGAETGILRLSEQSLSKDEPVPAATPTAQLSDSQMKLINALELDAVRRERLVLLLSRQLGKLAQKVQAYEVFAKPTVDVFTSEFFSRCLTVMHKHFVKPGPTFFNNKGAIHELKHKKPIIVAVPMSIPGCGKTYFGEQVLRPFAESHNFVYTSVSSDRIRNMFIAEYMETNANADADLGFRRTDKKAGQAFKSEFYNALRLAMEDKNPRAAGYVIFRDRNHPSMRHLESIAHEVKSALKGYNALFVLMVPRKVQYANQGLSYEDLFRCLYRVKNRRDHETLPYKGFDTFMTVMYNCYMSFRSVYKTEVDTDAVVEYYAEEEFAESCKEAVAELIEVFKDYNALKREKKPVAEKNIRTIRERYVSAIEKLEVVPRDFEPLNRERLRALGEEVQKGLKINYTSLEVRFMESHKFFIRDCIAQMRHMVEPPNLPDFDAMLAKTEDWKDVEPLRIDIFRASRDKAERARQIADFECGTRVPVKVYVIVYIPGHEASCYALRQHKVFTEVKAPRFTVRRKKPTPLEQEMIDAEVAQFAQQPENGYFAKLEPEALGGIGKLPVYLYRLKNEKILDGLCNINYA